MNNKKVVALIIVFVVGIISAIPLSIYLSSALSLWLHQNNACFYPNPTQYCTPINQFQQFELDDLNHASVVGLVLLWLGIAISGVLSVTVFRRMSLSTIVKWSVLSIGLVIAVLLPLLTWRSFVNPPYMYACALSLPIALLSIALFLIPQTAQRPASQQSKEPAKQDEKLLSLQQAVRDNPQSFEAWTDLAFYQHKRDLNDDALVSANKALTLNKKYTRAWVARGAALSTMDDQEDKALEALERALIDEPDNLDALYYKGRVLTFQGKNDDAHDLFDRVLDLDPTYKDALVTKGTLYLAVDNYDGVLEVANLLIDRFPDDAVGRRMQGTAYQFQGEQKGVERDKAYDLLGKALTSFNQALEIDPTDSNTYLLKAGPYAVIRDYGNALEALNQGLKIDPTNTLLQEAKADILGKRTKATASKVAGTAGRMALGGGLGLVKGSGRVGKMFWDVFKDDMRKP